MKLLSTDDIEEKNEGLVNIEINFSNKYENIPESIMNNILDYKIFDDRIGYRSFPRNGVAFYKGKFYQNVYEKLYNENMNILIDKKGNEIITNNNCNCKLLLSVIELPKFKIKNKNNNDDND
ncbi:hypothetical protein BCR36DRAFT_415125 [Piromyces finnis]|uniref:Uncharacterized protein n=1 Tax=Piromyces finnis TaxID=1754191 RepID=A0A1Y1V019_9FUNG|nr:hypothetical protein BCR36DRAFT_415125 [Piromyces finnis]|eukprot:ORX44365.1 hypothetical protein BCR36DRAFT_415125 [Piromyces finnis]